ncbi:MAG: glutamate--tRNA ligase, partial [Fidelibacterota bacterium]
MKGPRKKVRVRFAPSPTGHLHVGGARTAVYNWLFARKRGGKFLIRIEDTDKVRSDPEMVEEIFESLRWLGLDWDEEPLFQSRRLERYSFYVENLLKRGMAYYCYCNPRLFDVKREIADIEGQHADRSCGCGDLTEREKADLEKKGAKKAVRFKIPPGKTAFTDGIHGDV